MKKIAWEISDGKINALLISERRMGEEGMEHFERMVDMATEMIHVKKINHLKFKVEMYEVVD